MSATSLATLLIWLPLAAYAAPVLSQSSDPVRHPSEDRGTRRIVFSEPAYWIPDTTARSDIRALSGDLPTDKGRLLLSNEGVHYVERLGDESSETLTVLYADIATVTIKRRQDSRGLLIVNSSDRSNSESRSHAFLFTHPEYESQLAASQAAALIESRLSKALAVPSVASLDAPRESRTHARPQVPEIIAREERIAILAAQWRPAIDFGQPMPLPLQSGKFDRFTESVGVGAAIGATPLALCGQVPGCSPAVIVPGLTFLAAGAAAGALVGIVREFAEGTPKVAPPPGFSPLEMQAAAPVLLTAAGESLGQSELHECVQRRLSPRSADQARPVRWTDSTRTASPTQVTGTGPFSPGGAQPYPELSRSGFRHLVEVSLSNMLVVPGGSREQQPSGLPATIVVEGILHYVDLENGQSKQRQIRWRAEPRTLQEWSAAGGTALNEALAQACEELGEKIVAEAEHFWRSR